MVLFTPRFLPKLSNGDSSRRCADHMVERKKVNCTISRRFILKMVGNLDVGRWGWLQQQTTLL